MTETALESSGPFAAAAASGFPDGWHVFPVAPIGEGPNRRDGKKPYPGTHSHKDATIDPDQIATWASAHPDANIGLFCAASGIVVFDVDLDIEDPEQLARWQKFRESHDLPETYEQSTAGGGLHLFYLAAPEVKYPGSISDEDGKIGDIKHNGYVLLAPSVALSGRRDQPGNYKTLVDRSPVKAPEWLSQPQPRSAAGIEKCGVDGELAAKVRNVRRREHDEKLLQLMRFKRNTIKSRDDWLRLGFAFHAGYVGTQWENEAYAEWLRFSDRWEVPAGTKHADFHENAHRIWEDATANKKNGVMPATAQMILGRLPDRPVVDQRPVAPNEHKPEVLETSGAILFTGLAGAIADALRQANDRELKVFPEAAAVVAMSALAAPCFVIKGPQGLATLNVFALLLGGTGSGKESARKATDMVLKAAGRRDELLDGVASDKALHRALTEGGEQTGNDRGSRGARVIAVDEGGLHLNAIRKGNNGHQQLLLAFMMRLFGLGLSRVAPHKYADNSNEIPAVLRPRLTTIWTSTPGAFERATGNEDSESGQLNRFLVFKEEGLAVLRDGKVDRDLLDNPPEDIVNAARKFPARDTARVVAEGLNNEPLDKIVRMTTDGEAAIEAFRRGEVEDCRHRGGQEGESWARAAEYALRVSGLMALSDAAMEGKETLEDVVCERRHVDLAIDFVRRAILGVAELAKNSGLTQTEQLKEKIKATILELADEHGYAKAALVKKKVLRGETKNQRANVLDTMIDDEEISVDTRETGGRPGEYYAIVKKTD